MQLGDCKLIVQLACPRGGSTTTATNYSSAATIAGIDLTKGSGPATEVLCLMNMISEEELKDEEEYEGEREL